MKESSIHTEKILSELDTVVIQPYLAKQVESGKYKVGERVEDLNVLDVMDFE